MGDPIRALLAEMADALDHNRQCLMDDRRLTHPLADRARAALAAAQGEAEPSEEDWDALVQNAWDEHHTMGDQGERFMWESDFESAAAMLRDGLARWGRPAQPASGEAAELSPKEIEARDAFTAMRDEILHGLDGFDPDQTNAVLHVIDNHAPEWV